MKYTASEFARIAAGESTKKCGCPSGNDGDDSWVEYDARGIYLCRVCDKCKERKLSKYRPCILTGYDQSDVDEPIEPEGD